MIVTAVSAWGNMGNGVDTMVMAVVHLGNIQDRDGGQTDGEIMWLVFMAVTDFDQWTYFVSQEIKVQIVRAMSEFYECLKIVLIFLAILSHKCFI
jgi:hypothetical protein